MASMRDAMKRLQVIYEDCSPEAAEEKAAEKGLDEFTRLKKKVHSEVKSTRVALKEREDMLSRYGTTSETAEASYRVRVQLRTLKEHVKRMEEIVAKAEKKKGKKAAEDEELQARKETCTLCNQHIQELENLEKRRFLEQADVDRVDLFTGSDPEGPRGNSNRPTGAKDPNSDRQALFEGGSNKKKKGKENAAPEPDPFASALPEIDEEGVAEDFAEMDRRNQALDQDIEDIGAGVKKLKEIALNMNQELDNQHENLDELDKNVDKALDGLDNVNIKMKVLLEKGMKGDKFMVNCIFICVILALIAFIANLFF